MASQAFQLVMKTGPIPGKVYELQNSVVSLGRDIANDIVINDPEISRKHAKLTRQTGGYLLEDLGSTNGTYVNGQRLMGPHLLRPGELIVFGEQVSLVYDTSPMNMDATLIAETPPEAAPEPSIPYNPPLQNPLAAPPPQAAQPIPPQQPAYQPPFAPTLSPGYPTQPPPYPEGYYTAPPYEQDEDGRSSKFWFLGGCGCLVLFLVVAIAAIFAFDMLNLYCVWPFDQIFSFLWTCPLVTHTF